MFSKQGTLHHLDGAIMEVSQPRVAIVVYVDPETYSSHKTLLMFEAGLWWSWSGQLRVVTQ